VTQSQTSQGNKWQRYIIYSTNKTCSWMVATSTNNQRSDNATSRLLGWYGTTSYLMLSIPPEVPGWAGSLPHWTQCVVSCSLGSSHKSWNSFSYLWSCTPSEQFLCSPLKLASLAHHKVQPWNFSFWEERGNNIQVTLHFWVTVMHPTRITWQCCRENHYPCICRKRAITDVLPVLHFLLQMKDDVEPI
jgi:hypothetical protein